MRQVREEGREEGEGGRGGRERGKEGGKEGGRGSPALKANMELLKLLAVSIIHCQHILLQGSLEGQQLNVGLTQQSNVCLRGDCEGGGDHTPCIPHCSIPILPAKIIDVDQETVAMGTDHIPHLLMVEALVLLRTSRDVCACLT